jgi:NAD(P)-dependent dehydrogenase (short-subunit alcohol dehydrogenase family)
LEKLAYNADDMASVSGVSSYTGIEINSPHKRSTALSSISSQFLDLIAHHDVYAAIDPKQGLKDSARDKVIFITGASRGIGQATAVAFAAAGAKSIYLTARSREALEQTRSLVERANPDTQCALSVSDVTDAASVEAAVADCVATFGGIDAADANAGSLDPWVKIGVSDPATWWKAWQVNLQGAYHVIRFTLPHLIRSAELRAAEGRCGGHLILLSSVGAQFVMPGASDYQTAKHAINRLCEFVQADHGEDGIKCFALHPGGVATDLGLSMPESLHANLIDTPELAAGFAVWLCSGQADWAKGRYLSANWDVGELAALQQAIQSDDLLVNRLRAKM